MRKITVQQIKNKEMLTHYLSRMFPNLKMSFIFKALRNKDIRINDQKISQDIAIHPHDMVTIFLTDAQLFDLPKELTIIYEDANVLAVYKPQGILSNTEYYASEDHNQAEILLGGKEPTLEDLVLAKYPTAIICHRLDRNTAGILLFAKNTTSYEELLLGFKKGYLTKEYIAYVSGAHFDQTEETLERYLKKDAKRGFVSIHSDMVRDSQKIITHYRVLTANMALDYAILSIRILTGKTHQIRAQMKNISHPIIGDSKYGNNEVNKRWKRYRQLLFAYHYDFHFPKESPLFYLNDIDITLDKTMYEQKLGE